MAGELAGVKLKIQRAYSHLSKLEQSIEKALDSSGERFSSEFDPQTKQQVYRAHDLPEIDPEWSLIVGDLLHNMRSALDHLAWQLVILDKGIPGDQTHFPVRETPFSKNGKLTTTQLQPPVKDPRILAALEACQPYRGVDGEPAQLDRNQLWWLHRLNIIDKHRLLLVVVCVLDSNQMWWGGNPNEPVPKLKISTAPLKEGSPVAWFDWGNAEPPPHFNPHLSLTISLNEPEILGSVRVFPMPLVTMLDAIIKWTEWEVVMAYFEPLFA